MAKQYYTDPILFIILLIAILISLKNRKRFKLLSYFPIYIASLLLLSIIYELCAFTHFRTFLLPLLAYGDYFFTLLELIVFSHFYYQLISNSIIKRSILVANALFVFAFIYMGLVDKQFYQSISESTQAKVYTIEAVILLFICSFYFFEMFQNLPFVNLRNEPAFWISTGLLFFLTCTLPYSFLENYISKYYPDLAFVSYSIFYVFYILLFATIIRAYLCKPFKSKFINY